MNIKLFDVDNITQVWSGSTDMFVVVNLILPREHGHGSLSALQQSTVTCSETVKLVLRTLLVTEAIT